MAKHVAKLTLDLKSFAPPPENLRRMAMAQGAPAPEVGHCHASKVVEFMGQGNSAEAAVRAALDAMDRYIGGDHGGEHLDVVPREEPEIVDTARMLGAKLREQ